MPGILVALLLFGAGAAASLIPAQRGRWPGTVGAMSIVAACVCGVVPSARIALGAPAQSLRVAWAVPYGSFFLGLDALSGFFLLPIFLICALAAIYGTDYQELADETV